MKFGTLICFCFACLCSGTAWSASLPSSFDLRDIDGHSYIGAIRDQDQCGACWAFGTLAAAESTWNRTHGLYDEQTIDFSEAFLVWSLSPLYDGLLGCSGGSINLPQNTALIEYGVPLEEDFPYTIVDPGDDLHWDAQRYSFLDWYRIPPGDIETTRRILYQIGAVTAAVLVEDDFYPYKGGIFTNQFTAIDNPLPYQTSANHLIALVGWNDAPGDDGLGYWILRNSWDPDRWGEDGYMDIRYTTAGVSLHSAYMTLEEWNGDSVQLKNSGDLSAIPWSSGGTLNAHGVDLWGGSASSVTNRGTITAEAYSDHELATARGVYLWGGPDGRIVNEGAIGGFAASDSQQANAYAICLQGGLVDNGGVLAAEAESHADQALAFGVWAANGGSAVEIRNSGAISASAEGSALNAAYGIWADSRALVTVINSGSIEASADDYAVGVLLSGGPARLENSGTIRGAYASVYSQKNTLLVLDTGSNLIGPVYLKGDDDELTLTGNGSEDESFHGVETLAVAGSDWSLSGDSTFDRIVVGPGRLGVDGALQGDASVLENGILGGKGSLNGNIANSGTVAPGASVGHLTIDGDLSQSSDGTLEIEIGDGVADLLTITGTADLAGTLLVLPDGYATGDSYTFLEAGTIEGGFDGLASAAILSVSLDNTTADSLSLDVTRNSYASLAKPHNRSLAANLDGLRPTADGDLGVLLDTLDLALNQEALNDAMAGLTPRIHGLASTVLLGDAQARLADLRHHLQRLDPSAQLDRQPLGKTSAWLEVIGQYNRYGSDGAFMGIRENLYGLLLGVERTTKSLTLGVAAAVTESRLEAWDTSDDSEIESQQGYLYVSWRTTHSPVGMHLDVAAGGGLCQLETDRVIPFAGRKTHSEHEGSLIGATISGGYALSAGQWTLDPAVGLSFVHLREEGFRESGADSADLKIAARNNDSLQSQLGLRLNRPLQLSAFILEPELRMEWHHEFNRQTETLRAQLAGGGASFISPGRDLAGDSLQLGASLKARLSDMVSGFLDYTCDLQNHAATGHALRLHLAVAF